MKKADLTLSIIIVSYNTKDITIEAIDSAIVDLKSSNLLNQTEFLIADNNSPDDSVAGIRNYFKTHKNAKNVNHKIYANKDNKGFAGGNNQALKDARGEYVILLNPDTITQKGAFKILIDTFENNPPKESQAHLSSYRRDYTDRLGIIAPMLLNTDKTIQAQGGHFPSLCSLTSHMFFLDDIPLIGRLFPSTQHTGKSAGKMKKNNEKLTQIDWLGGTAMMIRREVINEIGGLDEGIFMYGEDIEYCYRAKNHHWDVAIQPNAKIIHLASVSAGSENAYTGEMKGYVYLWRKYKPSWQLPVVRMILRLACLMRVLLFTITGNKDKAGIYSRIFKKIPGF